MRTAFLALCICAANVCSAASADVEAILRKELAGLNLKAPESDAARDLAAAKPRCYSVNGFSRHFPAVTDERSRAYCSRVEVNLDGTSDVIQGKEHRTLIGQAIEYAKAYNQYVIKNRKIEP